MRVLTIGNMYPPHHLGGYELTWRSSVHQLRDAGHEVRVLTTDYRRPAPEFADDPDVHRELRWYWEDHEFPRRTLRERLALERHNAAALDRHLDDLRPDAVAWWAMGGMSLGLVERVRRRGIPAVGVVGDDWMAYAPRVDGWQRAFGAPRPLAWLAERVTGLPTRADGSEVLWLFNSERTLRGAGPLPRARVAHPGVDTELFEPAPAREWAWRLLYVGRIDERKGIDTAVGALAELPAEAELTVLGSGDERVLAELRRQAAALGAEERVRFGVEPRQRLPAAYAAADALLFPVRWEEPWGIVPLEAMAVGTPVVATGTGGSREYLRHEQNALVLGREASASDFAAAVRRLAAEPALCARLRAGGLETAARHDERAYNRAIEQALLEVAQAPSAS